MAHNEFDLISKYFSHVGKPMVPEVLLGVGDDAALVSCQPDPLAIAVDTLVEGVHFFKGDPAESVAHKALMVNLSDLSAMGATPFGFLLSLTIPTVDDAWMRSFSATLHQLADANEVQLIGGDTTAGPLTVSITALGYVKASHALRRTAARVDDDIYVTGQLGLASYYVYALKQGLPISETAKQAYLYPQPPIALGAKLVGLAHAAIDVSDGLMADLSHILKASRVGARLVRDAIPIAKDWQLLPDNEAFEHAVTGGDDYVLCFTAPKSARALLASLSEVIEVPITRIGDIVEGSGIIVDDKPWTGVLGYTHF